MIFLIQDFKNQDNNPKLLKITGPPADVERVKQTVQLLIDSCDVNPVNPSGETSTVQLKVPRSSVGAIMGVRGTNIMKLSRDTGCKIQFVTEDNAVIQERVMIVVGHPNCVNLAVQAIKAIVDTNTVEMGKQMVSRRCSVEKNERFPDLLPHSSRLEMRPCHRPRRRVHQTNQRRVRSLL